MAPGLLVIIELTEMSKQRAKRLVRPDYHLCLSFYRTQHKWKTFCDQSTVLTNTHF